MCRGKLDRRGDSEEQAEHSPWREFTSQIAFAAAPTPPTHYSSNTQRPSGTCVVPSNTLIAKRSAITVSCSVFVCSLRHSIRHAVISVHHMAVSSPRTISTQRLAQMDPTNRQRSVCQNVCVKSSGFGVSFSMRVIQLHHREAVNDEKQESMEKQAKGAMKERVKNRLRCGLLAHLRGGGG